MFYQGIYCNKVQKKGRIIRSMFFLFERQNVLNIFMSIKK
jgi:hypothetical protein